MKIIQGTGKWLAAVVLAGCAVPAIAGIPFDLAFQMRELRRNDPPVVSPDGNSVAYVVVTPPAQRVQSVRFLSNGTPIDAVGARIHLGTVDGQPSDGAPPICEGRGNQWNPAWSPDGRLLAFYSDISGQPTLWIHRPGDGTCRPTEAGVIRASLFLGYQPRWSPDGHTIYVPLRPTPPLDVSDGPDTDNDDEDTADAPKVFKSGSEASGDASGAASFDLAPFLLANYNASLAAVDVETGSTRLLVDARAEPRPAMLTVSPSGQWISYVSVPAATGGSWSPTRQLVLVPARGTGSPVVIPSVEFAMGTSIDADYRWAPGGDTLVYLDGGNAWSLMVDAGGPATPRRLAEGLGDLVAPILYFTRDGRSLVVGTDPQGKERDLVAGALAVVPLDDGPITRVPLPDPEQWQLLDLVRANEDVLWQPDPASLTVQVRHRRTGEEALFRIDIGSGDARLLESGLHRLRDFGSGGDHRTLHAVYEDIGTPPDVYRYGADLSRRDRVSVVEPRLQGFPPAQVKVVENVVPIHDGSSQAVRTTLLLPHGARAGDALPAIVMVYSGSDLSTSASRYGGGEGNTVPNQVFTSRGFAVVMADVRLSDPGEPGNPLQEMTDTLLPQVQALASAGYIDPGRLAISGQSFGGYSTVAIASATDLFRAGIAVNGTYDLGAVYGVMDEQGNSFMIRWAEKGQGRMGVPPWEDADRYIANSPYYRVDRIHTPLLLVAGQGDTTVPFEQSEQMFVGLRRMQKPARLLIYPGEGHSIANWSVEHAADAGRRMVEFLRKHLVEDVDAP